MILGNKALYTFVFFMILNKTTFAEQKITTTP